MYLQTPLKHEYPVTLCNFKLGTQMTVESNDQNITIFVFAMTNIAKFHHKIINMINKSIFNILIQQHHYLGITSPRLVIKRQNIAINNKTSYESC